MSSTFDQKIKAEVKMNVLQLFKKMLTFEVEVKTEAEV